MNAYLPYIWPLLAALVVLAIIRKVGDDLRPIVTAVVSGITAHAARNALTYAVGALMALLASLDALGDVATAQGWDLVAAACKVLQPGLAAIATLALRGQNNTPPPPKNGSTGAPFPPASPP